MDTLTNRIAALRTIGGTEIIRGKPVTAQQRSQEFRAMLSPFLGEITANLLEAATRSGSPDLAACKVLLERLVPLPRAGAENPGLKVDTSKPLAQQARQVVTELAAGADLDAAAAVVSALNAGVKIAEQTELMERLDALEQAAAPRRNAAVTPLRAVANGVPNMDDLA